MDCIFCEFVSGKRKIHRSGYPFITINETQNTISFMAIDIPATEDGHLLVIPKIHFTYIEDLPNSILHETNTQTKKELSDLLGINLA